jgi:catechol 2,3-dioxygenase-like lactoylglutathione lyase family enzyme
MLDHAGFGVSDCQRSKAFYEKALAPLGVSLLTEPMGRPLASAGTGSRSSGSRSARRRYRAGSTSR